MTPGASAALSVQAGTPSSIFIESGSEAVEREIVLRIGAIASQVQVSALRLPDTLLDVPLRFGNWTETLGNTNLRQEQSWSATAGTLWIPGDNVRIEGRLFEHRLEDMILSRPIGSEGTASIYRCQNVGTARIRGALAFLETALRRRIELGGSYQLLHTRDLGTAFPPQYSPRAADFMVEPGAWPAGELLRQSDWTNDLQRHQQRGRLQERL
jgi:hypothetical protein